MEQEKENTLPKQPLRPEGASEADAAGASAPNAQEEPAENASDEASVDQRRAFVQLAAGAYLLYTAYQLIASFVNGIDSLGWTTEMILCLVGAAVFIAAGGYFFVSRAVRLVRHFMKKD